MAPLKCTKCARCPHLRYISTSICTSFHSVFHHSAHNDKGVHTKEGEGNARHLMTPLKKLNWVVTSR